MHAHFFKMALDRNVMYDFIIIIIVIYLLKENSTNVDNA